MAVTAPGVRSVTGGRSLFESVVAWAAKRRAARARTGRLGLLARVGLVVADLLGTVVGLGAFTTGAFLLHVVAGWMVGGVAVLLLDFKVSVARRERRERR